MKDLHKYDVVSFEELPAHAIFVDLPTGIKFEKINIDLGAKVDNGAKAEFYPDDRCQYIAQASASCHAPEDVDSAINTVSEEN